MEGEKFLFSEENLTVPQNICKGDPLGFSNIHSDAKKLKGGPFGEKITKKSLAVPKQMKGGTLWSRTVWFVTRKNRKNVFGLVR